MKSIRRVIILMACLLSPAAAGADWYNSDWIYRMPVSLDSAQVTAALNDFPVLINTTDEEGFVRNNLVTGVGRADGGDIVFTAGDGTTVLPHEIEFFNDASGVLVAWVRVTELDPDGDTELFVYYGNEAAADMQQVPAVWSNGYRMVQHLQEPGGRGTALLDSTAQGNSGEVVGTGGNFPTFFAGGLLDGARLMPGRQQGGGGSDQPHIRVPHQASLAPTQTLTAEVWARADSDLGDGNNHHPIMFKGERIGWGANYLFRIAVRDGAAMTWGVTCGNTEGWFAAGTPRFDQWAHYAITFDGTTTRAYINGQQVGSSTACSGRTLNSFPSEPLRSGWTPRRQFANNDQSFYRGDVDELRISAASRSQAWLLAQFNNQSSPAGFHAFAQQETELAESLAAFYQMDELGWTGAAGEVTDSSGNGLAGTAFGGADTAFANPALAGDPGTCGYGDFDGASGYVEIPHDDALNGAEALTYTAWINPRSHFDGGAPRQVMAKSVHGGGSGRAQMGLFTQSGDFWARVETQDGQYNAIAALPPLDQWTHVVAVFDGESLRLYYDGTEVADITFAATTLIPTTDPLVIGKRVGSAEYFWDGLVDEVRVYTAALDSDQIAGVRDDVRPCGTVVEDLLISYWFDEDWSDSGNEIPDRSGEGRIGIANGAEFQLAGPAGARPGNPGTCGFADIAAGANLTAPLDDAINNADSFTASFWLQMTPAEQNNATPSLLAGGDLESFFAERFEVLADFNGARDLLFFVRQDGGPSPERVLRWTPTPDATNDPFSGEWVHLSVRHDMDNRQLRIYANGALVAQSNYGNQGPGRLVSADGPVQLGGFSSGVAPAAIATDEFRFVGRAATDDEIDGFFREERACATGLSAFEVGVAATASVCVPAPVTLTALDDGGNVLTNYTGTANLSTSSGRGNWAIDNALGTLSPDPHTTNNGAASYTFVNDDNGSVSLTLANASADRLTITATDADEGQSGTSDPVHFQENALVISVTDSLGDDFIARRDHGLRVEAVRRDPDTGDCGLIADYDGSIDVKGWVARSGDDPGGANPAITAGAGVSTLPDTEPAGNNITIVFNQGAGVADWQTTDVGQYALNLKDDSSGIVVDEAGNPLPVVGAGAVWTVRPFGFHVSVTDNPGADTPGGLAFRAAGRPFEVQVRAVAYEASDDSNADGQPDGHEVAEPDGQADLSNNETTPAFGNGPGVTVDVTAALVAGPVSASDPGLSDPVSITSFNNGEATASASYPEVGSISLLADLRGSYLGRAVPVIGRSGYIGRFHPELFTVQASNGSFAAVCNGFVYSGQAHGYDLAPEFEITPRRYVASGTGDRTSNYRGTWQRLSVDDIARTLPVEDGTNALSVEVTAAAATLGALGDGRMEYLFGADSYTYVKDENARQPPFTSDLSITVTAIDDGDAQLDPAQAPLVLGPSGAEIRYGRLRLDNAFGPETGSLIVGMRAEYWDDGRFRLNPDEGGAGCWEYNTTNDVILDQAGLSGGSTAVVPVEDTLLAGEPMSGSELTLTAPGEGNTGVVGVEFTVPVWLQADFVGDGTLQNPTATATFGVYRGHDRIIYWREVSD